MTEFESLIAAADPSLFRVRSQTSISDRRSLLETQRIVRQLHPGYGYLEVGSHLGGSIFPHLIDDRCSSIVSIDPRPSAQPDERAQVFAYNGNSTRRMIETLAAHASPDVMSKLRTFDSDVAGVSPEEVGGGIRLALIDAEHTNRAAFRDFVQVLRMVEDDAIIGFHDSNLLVDALFNIEVLLGLIERRFQALYLPDYVYIIALGEMTDSIRPLAGKSIDPESFYKRSKTQLWNSVTAGGERPRF